MNAPTPRPAERAGLLAPVLLCTAVVVAFYGGLLIPGRGLAARDIPFLHLPLRSAFRALLASGATPTWDPWEHGGQPLLSNPHYAAFYPFTWLLLWLPPLAAIHATVVLHGTLAFAGAWRLARRWELGRIAAAVAAIGFSANGAFASLPGTLLMFCGFAWLPWAWSLAGPLLARPRTGDPSSTGALSPLALLAGVLALQMLNGDPAAVLVTWLGLAAIALVPPDGAAPLGARLRRLGGALALGVLLASVQVMPTWARLQDSARGAGLGEESTVWSTRPLRLLEALNPRLFGDPTRDEEDLYFGAPLNDKNFPFLQSIYSGCLLTSLGLATLALAFRRRPGSDVIRSNAMPVRGLALAAVLGILLGLGRFDPLWPVLRSVLPFLDLLRYPEKFLLLTLAAVVFAGAAGLDRLLNAPAGMAKGLRRAVLGVALGLVAFDAIAFAVSCGAGPAVRGWIARAALAPLPAEALTAAAQFLRHEMALALVCAGLSLALLFALGRPRRRRALGIAAVALLFLDLAYYGRRALPTVPAEDLTTPRAPARSILASSAADQRLFSDALFAPHESTGGFRIGTPGTRQIETLLDALTPSSASTTGLAYALHRDFDLMLTGWGRQALAQAQALGPASPRLPGLLAAWNVGTLLRARSPEEQVREFRQTHVRPLPVEAVPVSPTLSRWRFAASAELEPDAARAFEHAAAGGFDLAHRETLVAARAGADPLPELDPAATVLSVVDHGGSVTVRYRARGAALFVAAQTFDDGWTAHTADAALPTWPTALGQLAVLVPAADEGTLSLRYSDPWLKVGGAMSAVTVLALLLAASRRRRGVLDPLVPPPPVA